MLSDLGVTAAVSSTGICESIRRKREYYGIEFKDFDSHIWQYFELYGQDVETFSRKMGARRKLLRLIRQFFKYCPRSGETEVEQNSENWLKTRFYRNKFKVLAPAYVYPEARLVAVGSTVNGCGAYNSDMDLCMCLDFPKFGYLNDRQLATEVLSKLAEYILERKKDYIKGCILVPARVPILKLHLQLSSESLEVDLNCNNIAGIYNSHLLHYYARIDDRFPALCLIVKRWACNAGINDAMDGTFNSYTLNLLVLHFLQCGVVPPVLPNLQYLLPERFTQACDLDALELFGDPMPLPEREVNQSSVGELLMGFFDYYSNFGFEEYGISIERSCIFPRKSLPRSTWHFKVYVEDPFDFKNTARTVTEVESFQRIKLSFVVACNALFGPKSEAPMLVNIGVS